MSIVKSFSVGVGDMMYIRHGSDNFTIIDCDLGEDNADRIIAELKAAAKGKGICRFVNTHPDGDHFGGIERLDDEMPISNFYVVKNLAMKEQDSASFERYCALRDDASKAFYLSKGCTRRWMNSGSDERGHSGLHCLWPDLDNEHFKEALQAAEGGTDYNNISTIIRYHASNGASFLWLGDLETEFMEKIEDSVDLNHTTVVFAAHHGRDSGKIPNSWLDKLKPKIIVIGEAPSRHLNYYSGYKTVTQNLAEDITMDCTDGRVDFYSSSSTYYNKALIKYEGASAFPNYFGSVKI